MGPARRDEGGRRYLGQSEREGKGARQAKAWRAAQDQLILASRAQWPMSQLSPNHLVFQYVFSQPGMSAFAWAAVGNTVNAVNPINAAK